MTRNEALHQYLKTLPLAALIKTQREIREKCDITTDILNNWRYGKTKIRTIYWDKIQEILGIELQADVE